jgi:hypothetical protein
MKYLKFKHILGVLACSMLFTACSEDILNVTPNDQLLTANLYKTPKQAEQSVIGIYANLRFITNDEFLLMSEVRSDNAWVNPKTDGLREYSEIGTFRANSEITTFNATWCEWYKVILDANTAIQKIPNISFVSETFKNQLLGESYFLRGWAYFELVRLFGNVPLIDQPLSATEVAKIPQSKATDIYEQIILPDMRKAISYLPINKDMKNADNASVADYGRADKIAATAMLGRIYITMSGFPLNNAIARDSAEVKLKAVIDFSTANSNKYWAADSLTWKKQWIADPTLYNKYSIFAIQHRIGNYGNPAVFNFSPALPPTYTNKRIFGNQIYINKSLMYEMTKLNSKGKPDARVYNTTILTGYAAEPNWPAYSNLTQSLTLTDGTTVNNVYTNSMFYKYMNSLKKRAALGYTTDIETPMKDYNDWPVNYPVIRLEDVQLMYAEILLNKSSDVAGAIAIVNKIRTRAGMDALSTTMSATDAMKAVKFERQIELCGEGVRWFDLVRWNEWKAAITAKFNSYNTTDVDVTNIKDGRYLYPIPYNQMIVQPGLYVQNADYN